MGDKKSGRMRRIARETSIFLAVVAVMLSAKSSLADHYFIPTGSMEPTVHAGDRIIVNKAAYDLRLPFSDTVLFKLSGPTRGDVVVLDSPDQDLLLLKRVVAIPGDRVAVQGGQLLLNNEPIAISVRDGTLFEQLGEEHAILLDHDGGPDMSETLIPPDRFLVLGDNRGDSRDGRIFGLISRSAIRGRAVMVYRSQAKFAWRDL